MAVAVTAAGVDTWSPCWYISPHSNAADWLDQLATVQTARGSLLPDAIEGHRVGWNRGVGMLYAEGHPGEGLLSPDSLPDALARLTGAMVAHGVPVPNGLTADVWMGPGDQPCREDGFAGIRRLDATVDIATDSTAEGVAVLAGVAAIARDAPRGQAVVHWSPGSEGFVETVYFRGHGGGKVLGRWYDKGVESGTARRGRLVRPEDQRRYVKGNRRDVGELTSEYVRGQFHQRFAPLWRASKGVTVAGPIVIAEKLDAAVQAGEITAAAAERVAGHLLLSAVQDRAADRDGPARQVGQRTARRRRAAARELGLILADGVLVEVEVDLHDVLERALDGVAWAPQG